MVSDRVTDLHNNDDQSQATMKLVVKTAHSTEQRLSRGRESNERLMVVCKWSQLEVGGVAVGRYPSIGWNAGKSVGRI